MCGCGTTEWCDGGCDCGCDHGTPEGMRRQGEFFARNYQDALKRAQDAYERGVQSRTNRVIAYIQLPCLVGDLVTLLDGERALDLILDAPGKILEVRI
jgi:hypothetical protein